jgi:serine/threonine-protein kinase PknK
MTRPAGADEGAHPPLQRRRGCTPGVIGRVVGVAVAAVALLPTVAGASQPAWRLPAPVYRTTAVVAGGRIYVLGGHDSAGGTISDVYVLNPATGVSRRAGSLALPTHGGAAVSLGGRILVFGGASTAVHDVVQEFSPAAGQARVIGRMPGVRADVTAVVVGRRAVLVGGFAGVGPQQNVWATSNGESFRTVAYLPQPVRYPAVAALGSAVYVFGGLISGGEYTGTFTSAIQRISLPSGSAKIVGHLPTPLAHAMAAVVNGRIYVLGGSAPAGPSAAIRRFDPASSRITLAGRLPRPLTDAAIATIGRTVYLLGGISNGPLATVFKVQPQ